MDIKAEKAIIHALIDNHDDIVRFLTHRFGMAVEVQDIVQETFFRLRNIATDTQIENPRSYVFKVANNLALDRVRQRSAKARYLTSTDVSNAIEQSPSPERVVDYRQRLGRLRVIIDELPARQREAFLKHKFDGLSHAEIALAMGISKSGVEKLIMKALAACRDGLGNILD